MKNENKITLTLIITVVVALFSIINSFPPYDYILCAISGIIIGYYLAKYIKNIK